MTTITRENLMFAQRELESMLNAYAKDKTVKVSPYFANGHYSYYINVFDADGTLRTQQQTVVGSKSDVFYDLRARIGAIELVQTLRGD